MTMTNGNPVAAVPMTEEQKFFFDLRGWLLLPAVLSAAEIEEMKAEAYAGAKNNYEGKLQELLDHPAIVGVLAEILSEDPFQSEENYSFRCEGSFITVRPPGWSKMERSDGGLPHVVRPPQQANAMRYQVAGKIDFRRIDPRRLGAGGSRRRAGRHHVPERLAQGTFQLRRARPVSAQCRGFPLGRQHPRHHG